MDYNLWSIQQVFHRHKTFGSRRQGMHVVAHALSLAHTWHHINIYRPKEQTMTTTRFAAMPAELDMFITSLGKIAGTCQGLLILSTRLVPGRVRIRLKLSVAICKAHESMWFISFMHSRKPQDPQCIYQCGPNWWTAGFNQNACSPTAAACEKLLPLREWLASMLEILWHPAGEVDR